VNLPFKGPDFSKNIFSPHSAHFIPRHLNRFHSRFHHRVVFTLAIFCAQGGQTGANAPGTSIDGQNVNLSPMMSPQSEHFMITDHGLAASKTCRDRSSIGAAGAVYQFRARSRTITRELTLNTCCNLYNIVVVKVTTRCKKNEHAI
jgi:hypothetical protein